MIVVVLDEGLGVDKYKVNQIRYYSNVTLYQPIQDYEGSIRMRRKRPTGRICVVIVTTNSTATGSLNETFG